MHAPEPLPTERLLASLRAQLPPQDYALVQAYLDLRKRGYPPLSPARMAPGSSVAKALSVHHAMFRFLCGDETYLEFLVAELQASLDDVTELLHPLSAWSPWDCRVLRLLDSLTDGEDELWAWLRQEIVRAPQEPLFDRFVAVRLEEQGVARAAFILRAWAKLWFVALTPNGDVTSFGRWMGREAQQHFEALMEGSTSEMQSKLARALQSVDPEFFEAQRARFRLDTDQAKGEYVVTLLQGAGHEAEAIRVAETLGDDAEALFNVARVLPPALRFRFAVRAFRVVPDEPYHRPLKLRILDWMVAENPDATRTVLADYVEESEDLLCRLAYFERYAKLFGQAGVDVLVQGLIAPFDPMPPPRPPEQLGSQIMEVRFATGMLRILRRFDFESHRERISAAFASAPPPLQRPVQKSLRH